MVKENSGIWSCSTLVKYQLTSLTVLWGHLSYRQWTRVPNCMLLTPSWSHLGSIYSGQWTTFTQSHVARSSVCYRCVKAKQLSEKVFTLSYFIWWCPFRFKWFVYLSLWNILASVGRHIAAMNMLFERHEEAWVFASSKFKNNIAVKSKTTVEN